MNAGGYLRALKVLDKKTRDEYRNNQNTTYYATKPLYLIYIVFDRSIRVGKMQYVLTDKYVLPKLEGIMIQSPAIHFE